MATETIKPGENVLIKLGLYEMDDGLTSRGEWDDATAYIVDDVVTHENVAYKCILGNTNQEPPNVIYWTALPVIDTDDILSIVASIDAQDNEHFGLVTWVYVQGQPSPLNLVLIDGLLTIELLPADSATLAAGTYDLRVIITLANTDYTSGGQTDALCYTDFLEVELCQPIT